MSNGFLGADPAAVVDLLRQRRERGPASNDGRKLALIVEGGGMRGVLSAGSLLAIDVFGYRPVFDEVYATSAGAVNAAYFLSGQGSLGITIYFDSISNRRFYNPMRLTRIVDVEFVYDHIVRQVKVLDEPAIRSARADMYVSVTDARSGENTLLDVKRTAEPIAHILKASSAMPVLYNKTVLIDGHEYVDGGVTCLLPLIQAAEGGCTDLLILLTRPPEYETADPTRLQAAILFGMLGRRYPALMRAYAEAAPKARRDRRIAIGAEALPGVNIATICPTRAARIVERTTIDRSRLVEGAHLMARAITDLLAEDPTPIDALFESYRAQPALPLAAR